MKVKKFELIDSVMKGKNYSIVKTPDKKIKLCVQCVAIPEEVSDFLIKNE